MNICVVGLESQLVDLVAMHISDTFDHDHVRINIKHLSNLFSDNRKPPELQIKKWVLTGAPFDANEYRLLSWAGYDPDIIIFVSSNMWTSEVIYLEKLSYWYDGRVSVYSRLDFDELIDNIDKMIKNEMI